MGVKVYLSTLGAPVDPEDATVSVFDRGFLYGDSVYETMRTCAGRPIELRRHLIRLASSAAGIGLEMPFTPTDIETAIAQTHAASANDESYVRVIVTRGAGPIALDPRHSTDPTLVVLVQPLRLPSADAYRDGIKAIIVAMEKSGHIDPRLKTGNYLGNILALRQAIARGGDDAILCNATGDVAEGATSNVFAVFDDALVTPPLAAGILPGITRQVVCELAAAAGHPPVERTISPDELRRASELFLTSSVRGIMPVTTLDGAQVGEGTVGPVTQRLQAAYDGYLSNA